MGAASTRMRAGNLRHRLTVETNIADPEKPNDDGEVPDIWMESSTYWGAVVPLSGKRLMEAKQIDDEITHELQFRGHVDLDQSEFPKRIRFKNRIFYMAGPPIDAEERGIKQIVMVKERV